MGGGVIRANTSACRYDFLKQASYAEQVSFLSFALDPSLAASLLPTASAFLKLHAHSFKSLKRFRRTAAFQSPHLLQLLCCAAEEFHVEHLSPVSPPPEPRKARGPPSNTLRPPPQVLAILWLFSKIPPNRSALLRAGVVGVSVRRMKRYTDLVRRKGLDRRKGVGRGMRVGEQGLCALTMLAGMCFE